MTQSFLDESMQAYWLFYGISIAIVMIVLLCVIVRQRKKWKQRLQSAQEQSARTIAEIRDESTRTIADARERAKSEIKEATDHAQSMIDAEKHRSREELQLERERIDARKETLKALYEKELMVKTVMALDGYATRLDRIEARLNNTVQIERLESEIQTVGQTVIDAIKSGISASISTTYDSDDLMYKLSAIEGAIASVEANITSLKSAMDD